MNVFKIAWRSIQHRGFGSWLTIASMALGVMLVVAVLSIHGLVSQSFKNNSSFGYNVLVGARGGGLQLTMSTVYYLSQPVENIPYEYYLAFCDAETRQEEMKHSIAWAAYQLEADSRKSVSTHAPGAGSFAAMLNDQIAAKTWEQQQRAAMRIDQPGMYAAYTHVAVPLCLGDFYVDEKSGAAFRCVGTNPDFFNELVLDVETEEKFTFSAGRCFETDSPENGFYECVLGARVANRCGLNLGDTIMPTHGDPNSPGAHIHETPFTIVGIVAPTGTPHDGVLFLNMEGFYLMDGHTQEIDEEQTLKTNLDSANSNSTSIDPATVDPFSDDEDGEIEPIENFNVSPDDASEYGNKANDETEALPKAQPAAPLAGAASKPKARLPIENREVTSILVRTSKNDKYGSLSTFLPPQINQGDLELCLDWSAYRPTRAQKAAQAVNPVGQVTSLFQLFVDPIRWLLLALTCLICVVSALSILVGIYNSMNQRQHEIAVMRALGANRGQVMNIMLCESILLALAGGLLGWIGGHALNEALGPFVEARTGVQIGFFSFAPAIPLAEFPYANYLPNAILDWKVSPEILLIPALILLAVIVGIYPAISAYRTDVSKSLGK